MIEAHRQDPGKRVLQKTLAAELTKLVHSENDLENAIEASNVLFSGGLPELEKLDEATFLEVFEGVPQCSISRSEIENGTGVIELLSEKTGVFPSKGEARKMIQGGGVSINKQKVQGHEEVIGKGHLIRNKYLVIQKGKKNYFLCSVN